MDVRPPIWPQRTLAWVCVLTLALVATVCAAGATNSKRAAVLKVSMPASMTRGSVLALTASGYSGSYDEVSYSSEQGTSSGCSSPGGNAIGMQAVAKQHPFKVKFTNIFGAPGTLTLCVYLFTRGAQANVTKGHYVAKSERLKVS